MEWCMILEEKKGVVHTEIILPTGSQANWVKEREKLWNVAEQSEKRKDARTAREIEIALPVELTHQQRIELTQEFSQHLADKYNVAVDVAIHTPESDGCGLTQSSCPFIVDYKNY